MGLIRLGIFRTLCCGLLAYVCAVAGAYAAEPLNVLVIGGDEGRGTPLFARARSAIDEELTHEGFAVFDDDAFDAFKHTDAKLTDSELIKTARALTQPMDALVIFAVRADAHALTYTTDLSARILGRVFDARTGQSLGAFDMASPEGWKVPITCESGCMMDALGKNIDIIAGNLGAAMGEKIALITPVPKTPPQKSSERIEPVSVPAPTAPSRPKDYTLVFTGFSADERGDLATYLHVFPGYRHEAATTDAAGAVTYLYDSAADSPQLDHSLHMMLDRIGAEGSVTFSADAKTFAIRRNGK